MDSPPLAFPVKGAVCFRDQAQLHATRYLIGLAGAVVGEGSHVFEESPATAISGGERCTVVTGGGRIRAKAAVVATNFPFLDRGLFFARCHMHRSYLLALAVAGELPDGAFISADEPLRSLMTHRTETDGLLLVGGEGTSPPRPFNATERYGRLEAWARERFPVSSLEYRWSTQDALPVDGVPYVGQLTPFSRNLYVATGFRKWGLSNGTVAGEILANRLLGRPNPWAKVFDSNRLKPLASGRRFVRENLRSGARLVRDRLSRTETTLPELAHGQGPVLEHGGEKVPPTRTTRGRCSRSRPSAPTPGVSSGGTHQSALGIAPVTAPASTVRGKSSRAPRSMTSPRVPCVERSAPSGRERTRRPLLDPA